jgi:hypothetical protein
MGGGEGGAQWAFCMVMALEIIGIVSSVSDHILADKLDLSAYKGEKSVLKLTENFSHSEPDTTTPWLTIYTQTRHQQKSKMPRVCTWSLRIHPMDKLFRSSWRS